MTDKIEIRKCLSCGKELKITWRRNPKTNKLKMESEEGKRNVSGLRCKFCFDRIEKEKEEYHKWKEEKKTLEVSR